jgi:plasmid stability protein
MPLAYQNRPTNGTAVIALHRLRQPKRLPREGSMEAEMRAILTEAVRGPEEEGGLLQALFDRFGALGGVDLDIAPRGTPPRGGSGLDDRRSYERCL